MNQFYLNLLLLHIIYTYFLSKAWSRLLSLIFPYMSYIPSMFFCVSSLLSFFAFVPTGHPSDHQRDIFVVKPGSNPPAGKGLPVSTHLEPCDSDSPSDTLKNPLTPNSAKLFHVISCCFDSNRVPRFASRPPKVPQRCSQVSFPHGTTSPNCQEKSPQLLRPL